MPPGILLVDDDALLRRSLAYTLSRVGYAVRTAGTAAEALEMARQALPDLVLLDIGLPGIDGLDALSILRRDYRIPVILLTARRGEQDETLGLTLGADDYVKKPYDTDVLLARIAAVLRRARPVAQPLGDQVVVVGSLRIDSHSRTASIGPQPLDLTPRAFDCPFTRLNSNFVPIVAIHDFSV